MSTFRLLSGIRSPADLKKLSIDQLPQLAEEIRQAICQAVSRSGGHLAPNLGVVELTIALHYVFDFSRDRLLFDVGHQCYPHKLLTGRLGLIERLRQRGGVAGFPEPEESEYDLFRVGHAGTAISTAVGLARGDQLAGEGDRRCVAVVGDASIVNGLAMEGLNNAGTLKRQFLVVLNDNGMGIAKPQGALAQYFDRVRISSEFAEFKRRAHEVVRRLPYGQVLERLYQKAGDALLAAVVPGHMFEHFGLLCLGPVDGHDLPTLIEILNEVKDFERPVLLHVKTIKGKGVDFAAADPTKFHSPGAFTVTGRQVQMKPTGRSFTAAFADAMLEMMRRDEKIYAVTAAMPDGTGLAKVMGVFPERVVDTGICESHAMAMCAGLAKAGWKPFFAVYSTFVQRALDQVFQEIALQGLAVRICLDRAGFVGEDGAVHHGFMDIAMFAPLPGVVMLAASDEPNLRAALEFMRNYERGCTIVRYPRAAVPEPPIQREVPPYELGKGVFVARSGGRPDPLAEERGGRAQPKPDVVILGYGSEVYEAYRAMQELDGQGYDVALYDSRFAKPVDVELVERLVRLGVPILTVEDHSIRGGFGACVLEACNERGLATDRIYRLAMPERWVAAASRQEQLAEAGLDAAGIARAVRGILDRLVRAEPEVGLVGNPVRGNRRRSG